MRKSSAVTRKILLVSEEVLSSEKKKLFVSEEVLSNYTYIFVLKRFPASI